MERKRGAKMSSFTLFISYHAKRMLKLKYGENSHQTAYLYQNAPVVDSDPHSDELAVQIFEQLQGKELSYNNILDIDAAIRCLSELGGERPACVIIKHGNPCGVAYGINEWGAFWKAWHLGDSDAAFGGIVAVNRPVEYIADLMLAGKKFDILLAPKVNEEALKIFSEKKGLKILVNPALENPFLCQEKVNRQVRGGWLVQEPDLYKITEKDLKVMTQRAPTQEEIRNMLFAWKVCKMCSSNTIVITKNEALVGSGEALVGSGVGERSRVKCCKIAVMDLKEKEGLVAASDAFFPFPDGPEILIKAGVKAIIQPGGSVKDQETIDLCNKYNIAMVFTGIRCFRH